MLQLSSLSVTAVTRQRKQDLFLSTVFILVFLCDFYITLSFFYVLSWCLFMSYIQYITLNCLVVERYKSKVAFPCSVLLSPINCCLIEDLYVRITQFTVQQKSQGKVSKMQKCITYNLWNITHKYHVLFMAKRSYSTLKQTYTIHISITVERIGKLGCVNHRRKIWCKIWMWCWTQKWAEVECLWSWGGLNEAWLLSEPPVTPNCNSMRHTPNHTQL